MLLLSYDVEQHQDGFGAQLQRYLGIIGICREYNVQYYHVPLEGVNYHGINSLLNSEVYDVNFIADCNSRLNMFNLNILVDTDPFESVKVKHLTEKTLMSFLKAVENNNKNIWLKVCYPFILPDTIHQAVQGMYRIDTPKNEIYTVGIHVRRGDIAFLETNIRFLPTSYYVNVLKKVNVPDNYVIEIYTEIPEEFLIDDKVEIELNLSGDKIPSEFKTSRPNIVLDSKMYDISDLMAVDKNNTVLYNNEDVFTTLDRMINCDVLITSKSSLSAVATFLKPVETASAIYMPFWTPLPSYAVSSTSNSNQ